MVNLRSLKPLGGHSKANVLLSPKANVRVGCWNVCWLGNPTRQNLRLCDVLCTMADKNLHILALSEVRWPGHGAVQFGSNATIHSGSTPDDPHH